MLKLAYFSPLPPERTGIARYSWEFLPFLAKSAEITLFHPAPQTITDAPYPIQHIDDYSPNRWEYDLPIYHMGNSRFHRDIYEMLKQHPGVVVLHDVVLHHFMAMEQYGRELGYAVDVPLGMDIRIRQDERDLNRFDLNRRVLDLALGVIVHSQYAADRIAQSHPELPVALVPMPILAVAQRETPAEHPLTFGCLGEVTPAKQIDLALRVFGRFHAQHPESRFHVVGDSAEFDLTPVLHSLPPATRANVYLHGYAATQAAFEAQIDALDVVINLRYPTVGETSAAALRALAHGKPVIVFDHGTYQALPDSVAIKVPPMDQPALLAAMQQAADGLPAYRNAARTFIETHHRPQKSAELYLTFLQQLFDS
ncbi:MAG: glycosyltransferase [Candidatus Promineifilaceae bacterium]